RAKVEQLRPFLPQAQPTVVEVGSFVGGFLAAARERGWNAIGVDPGEEVTAFCRERGLEVMRSSAADAPIAAGTADCVAIWNTFDQLPNPRPTLAAVRRWLRPRGLLVLRVPNGACYRVLNRALRRASPRWRRPLLAAMAWNNLLAFPYLWGYSPTSLDSLLAANGFDRIHLQPDTLTRLADETTKRWAVWEERLCKASWRAMARWKADTAPWFDAIYRIR
ncbi:MAG TPA: class I SAM-dependent methyltransferase, partial [Terriglobales bacterium]|nr:class I SAM-dependent methyltransferase [Terriglobales bacterium]